MNIILKSLGDIDEKYLHEVETFKRKFNIIKITAPLVACLVVVVGVSAVGQMDIKKDINSADSMEPAGNVGDIVLFVFECEVTEIIDENSVMVKIVKSNDDVFDELDAILNYNNHSFKVGDKTEITYENFYMKEGKIYEKNN